MFKDSKFTLKPNLSAFNTKRGRTNLQEKALYNPSNSKYEPKMKITTERASSYDRGDNDREIYGGSRKGLNDSFSEGMDGFF